MNSRLKAKLIVASLLILPALGAVTWIQTSFLVALIVILVSAVLAAAWLGLEQLSRGSWLGKLAAFLGFMLIARRIMVGDWLWAAATAVGLMVVLTTLVGDLERALDTRRRRTDNY
jgi:hypothetical protein